MKMDATHPQVTALLVWRRKEKKMKEEIETTMKAWTKHIVIPENTVPDQRLFQSSSESTALLLLSSFNWEIRSALSQLWAKVGWLTSISWESFLLPLPFAQWDDYSFSFSMAAADSLTSSLARNSTAADWWWRRIMQAGKFNLLFWDIGSL